MGSVFVHGAIAWAALALVSIPIIIHLINRRRFRRLDWAAMEFLLAALKKNRRRIRLEQLLLLLLRAALMAIIGLAIARPVLSERGLEWLGSAFRAEEKVFILDDSFSMSRREADRTAFQRASEALEAQVRRLAERGARDRVTLLRGSRHSSPLARGVFIDRERALLLGRTLSGLSPTDERLPLADALRTALRDEAEGGREEAGPPRPRSVLVVTDFRAADWTDGRGGPDEALRGVLLRLAKSEEAPARIAVLDVGADDPTNTAITRAAVEGGNPIAEIPADIRVTIRNFGRAPACGLGLRLRHARAPGSTAEGPPAETSSPRPESERGASGDPAATALGPPVEEIGPGASADYVIPCTFREPGPYGVTIEITGARDPLPGDDAYSLAVEAVSATEVLLVNGEPSSEPLEGETDFLEQALAAPGEVPSGIQPTVAVEESFPRQGLERFAAVFAANVHAFPTEMARAVSDHVRRGGALVIFLGDQVDPGLYNRQLGPGEDAASGLLPARIGELRDATGDPVRLAPAFDHPYFRTIREAAELLATARFSKHFVLEPFPSAQVLARFSDADGSPAIVERAAGDGRVILFATGADIEWNDWPRNPSYLMVLHELTSAAARSRSRAADHLAGAPIEVPVDIALHSREARLRIPGYPTRPEQNLTAAPAAPPSPPIRAGTPPAGSAALDGERAQGSSFRFTISDTQRAGLYSLALRTKSGGEEWRQLAVRRDPAESDLARMSAAELQRLYPEVEIDVIRDSSSFLDVGRGRFEASDLLLWGLFGLLFIEAFLARRFAHHLAGAEPRPGETP